MGSCSVCCPLDAPQARSSDLSICVALLFLSLLKLSVLTSQALREELSYKARSETGTKYTEALRPVGMCVTMTQWEREADFSVSEEIRGTNI